MSRFLRPKGRVHAAEELESDPATERDAERNGFRGLEPGRDPFRDLQHPNLICAHGPGLNLVEFESCLFASPGAPVVSFEHRAKAALGAAEALAYLHEQRVVPHTLLPSNIWVDREFNAKYCLSVSDLEEPPPLLAFGDIDYFAPEHLQSGRNLMASNTYSFGLLLLEAVSGRRVREPDLPREEQDLRQLARAVCREGPGGAARLADPRLQGAFCAEALKLMVEVGLRCVGECSESRPTMIDVVASLGRVYMNSTHPGE